MSPLTLTLSSYSRWLCRFKILHSQNALVAFSSTATTTTPPNENQTQSSGPAPPPIRVALTESAGRGVFATRKIRAGDTIHSAKPIVSHPSLSAIDTICYFCLKKMKPFTESQSQGVSFCCEKCKESSKMEEGFCLLRNAFTKANMGDERTYFLTKQWYTAVLARIRINAFRIDLAGGAYEDLLSLAAASIEAEAAVGNAIYMLPSFYNHDCDPNTHIIWIENADAKLKALRDIDEGEELRICYIDASVSCHARQSLLSQGFGFECNCLRCLSGD
ncbi:histone-lysine N-methyltransferase ATXR4 isoform X2 [Durio zibethinus]|uniref:Histone-lysine N-methyltransferase ATXR4 isoform X2 n=1 Tax=Durio zibethinus TaxID=66656 RepID=A0A6P5YVU9_DURZI|nr:histone-lysine N-methyltransferase ATXR4 isoform X2 [Durio zibethinus]